MTAQPAKPLVAIACGGTGGHLFPGLAVAGELRVRGCDVAVLISPKEVDQEAVKGADGVSVHTLPAVGLVNHRYLQFFKGFWQSYQLAVRLFRPRPPQAVLAMGGFTSAPPVHAGRKFGAAAFLHESNTIPGRANCWLARFVHQSFVGFPSTAELLARAEVVGTPVRPQFRSVDAADARRRLGFSADRPVLLVMGGSQGASGINDLVINSLDMIGERLPGWQFAHLTGQQDFEKVRAAYAHRRMDAVVWRFFDHMEWAMGAATVAISRAGASSQAELAALRLPAVLIPYPSAAGNHQYFNARAFAGTGAACLLEQKSATPERLVALLEPLARDPAAHARMAMAVGQWHKPDAAGVIADHLLARMRSLYGGRFHFAAGTDPRLESRAVAT